MGFVTPQDQWLNLLLPKLRSLLFDEPLRAGQFLDRQAIEEKVHNRPNAISSNMLWRIVNLEMWMSVFDVR